MNKYTDEEIQAYCDGSFTGDKETFRKDMNADKALRAEVESYQFLFHFVAQNEKPALSFDLADAVLQQLPAAEKKAARRPQLSFLTVIGIICVLIYLPALVKFLPAEHSFITTLSGAVVLLFVTIFHWVEYRRKMRMYEVIT